MQVLMQKMPPLCITNFQFNLWLYYDFHSDATLNMIYVITFFGIAVGFVIIGYILLSKLNHYFEDVYEIQKKSVMCNLTDNMFSHPIEYR